MAANRLNLAGKITATPTNGGTLSGDPALVGQIPCVSLNGGGATEQSLDCENTYLLLVKGVVAGPTNSPVNAGDIIYHDGATAYSIAGNTTPLTKINTGVRFGYAVPQQQKSAGATADPQVASGATGLCAVKIGFGG